MPDRAVSSAELTGVCQRLAAYYTALAEKETARGAAGYARLDKERTQCLILVKRCLESELWQELRILVWAIDVYLEHQGYWTERMTVVNILLTAAYKTHDSEIESWCLNNLGYIYWRRGNNLKALSCYERSLPIWIELGNKKEEGQTINNISQVYHSQGDYDTALQYLEQSLSIRQEIGDK
ncbi:MAG: tetratricopeptide repeat protein, partial [Candidatus Electrothrix sp. AW2]|nr:tetratricopeptide repeat protein [Candidatus Electrothrix gigas]